MVTGGNTGNACEPVSLRLEGWHQDEAISEMAADDRFSAINNVPRNAVLTA